MSNDMDGFLRPRYLLRFSSRAKEDLKQHVRAQLAAAGFQVDLDGLKTQVIDVPPFLVVSAPRELLEREAVHQGYVKAHLTMEPHVPGQGAGKIEFEMSSSEWLHGYEGYASPDFWLPCERAQLLHGCLEQVPADVDELKALQVRHPTALSVSPHLLPAMTIAGLMESIVPMDDDLCSERRALWKVSLRNVLTPVASVHRYFGSEVALYFAWMNHFTLWLLAPAGVGVAAYCRMNVFGYTVDDDPYLPFHSLFVVFWSACFLRSWDQRCSELSWHWNVHGIELLTGLRPEEYRPGYHGELRQSRATGQPERYYPYPHRILAYIVSVVVTSMMLVVAFCVMICSLNLQGYMDTPATSFEKLFYIPRLARLAHPGAIFDPNQTEYLGIMSMGPVVLHVTAIMHMNKFYRSVAQWLTELENHELVTAHQSSLIAKRFVFEAFDCYIALFYVGFVQQDIRKLRNELICLYGVDSIRRVFVESVLPLVLDRISRYRLSRRAAELKRQEQAHFLEALEALDQPEYEQFDDFLEMVIEFGYVTLFASAFPLAGVMSIVSNLIEMKSDMFKLALVYQRPMPHRASNIGIWRTLLHIIVAFSVATNVMIFTMSEQFASWAPGLYREASIHDVHGGLLAQATDATTGTADLVMRQGSGRYVIFFATVLEHLVGLAVLIVMAAIPREPEWVYSEILRTKRFKAFRAKEAAFGWLSEQKPAGDRG